MQNNTNSPVLNAVHEIGEAVKTRIEAQDKRIKELDSAITDLAQVRDGYSSPSAAGLSPSKQSLGDAAVKAFAENAELFSKSGNVRFEIKAATDPVTTADGRTIASGGVGAPQGGVLGIQYALPTRQAIGLSALEYSRFTSVQGGAALQATEGSDKAAVRPDHSLISQSALTVAGYSVMSKQAVSDSNELKRAVEITLSRSVATALDSVLYDGSVTPAWAGLESLATAEQTAYDTLADSVSDVAAGMQEAGFVPNAVIMAPSTWVEIMTLRSDSGAGVYLSGAYLGQVEPTLRGLPVYLSPSVTAGKALVLDTQHIELLVVQNPILQLGTTGSQFVQNLVTLLLETRVIPTFRAVGAAVLAVPANVSL